MQTFTLSSSDGIEVILIDYGATIADIRMPDRNGRIESIVLGYGDLGAYRCGTSYFGAVVGRYANRIARGRFTLDGVTCQLAINDPPNHLHGGVCGFDKRTWRVGRAKASAEPRRGTERSIRFEYTSPGGEEGYPGTLDVSVTYTLVDNELEVVYEATTDRATPINLTQHTYWNLTGRRHGVLEHELTIAADRYTPTDATKIPTGELAGVAGTAFDFRAPRPIGAGFYDHNWVLDRQSAAVDRPTPVDAPMAFAARVHDPDSGRSISVRTTEPGLQFYAGSLLDPKHWGLCLETQHFPDSPNHPAFPSTILRPGERFESRTTWRFDVMG